MSKAAASYRKQLAYRINGALTAAEKHAAAEGFAIYPFIVGYLTGDCTEEEIALINARIDRLQSSASTERTA